MRLRLLGLIESLSEFKATVNVAGLLDKSIQDLFSGKGIKPSRTFLFMPRR